jgi:hypothetical protein
LATTSGIRLSGPEAAATAGTREESAAHRVGQRLAMFVSERVSRSEAGDGDKLTHGEGEARPVR